MEIDQKTLLLLFLGTAAGLYLFSTRNKQLAPPPPPPAPGAPPGPAPRSQPPVGLFIFPPGEMG